MDSIYKSKNRIRSKKVRKQACNEVNIYDNNDLLNAIYSKQHHPQEFNEIKTEGNGERSVFIDENFRPNDLLLSNTNFIPNINGQTKIETCMTESSYTGCNDPTSQYKRMMILEMANSVISESNALFENQHEREHRPYEEQTEFQVSLAQNKITQQIVNNVINKYVSK